MAYIIETERLGLRELAMDDAFDLSRVLSDPNSMKYYPRPFTDAEVELWIDRNRRRYLEFGFGLWAVIRRSDGAFLGDCGITIQNIDGEKLPEVGFHIIGEYRRNGYASEAAKGAIAHARRTFGFTSIYSYCLKENAPSQAVMRKIGMSFVKSYRSDGREHVVYLTEVTN